jgi:hypothetical protein
MYYIPDDLVPIILSYLDAKSYMIFVHNGLVKKIISYLPIQEQMLLNKKYYTNVINLWYIPEHKIPNLLINYTKIDNEVGFKKYVNEEILLKTKKYYFDTMKFVNLFYLLEYICNKNNSFKCKNILLEINMKTHLKKNKHKNKIYKNIIWN